MTSVTKCPRCGGPDVFEELTEGVIFCDRCGVAVGDLYNAQEFTLVARADYGSAETDEVAAIAQDEDKRDARAQRQLISTLADKVGLPASVAQRASVMYAHYAQHRRRHNERITHKDDVIAACLHLAAGEAKLSITLTEVTRALHRGNNSSVLKLQDRIMTILGIHPDTTPQGGVKYGEMVERTVLKLLIPGSHTRTVATAMTEAFVDRVGTKPTGPLLASILYFILTTLEACEACGIPKSAWIPPMSPGDPKALYHLANHFQVTLEEVAKVQKLMTADVKRALLEAGRQSVKLEATDTPNTGVTDEEKDKSEEKKE